MSGDRLAHERAQMIHGLNGHDVDADTAWAIIHRWDALVEIAKKARAMHEEAGGRMEGQAWLDLGKALARLDSGAAEEGT